MDRTRAVAAGVLAASLTCLGAVSPATAGDTVSTSVASFSWTDADGYIDYFDGKVDSPKAKCAKHRRMVLYRKNPGPDPRNAASNTDRKGRFRLEIEDPGSGRYWVKAKRKSRDGFTCELAESGLLSVTDLSGV